MMIKSFKTEINPTKEQMQIINKNIGVCRFIYNLYISYNKELYDAGENIVGPNEFKRWLNEKYLINHPENKWIRDASSKAVTKSIDNAFLSFKSYLNGHSIFPAYKKKGISDAKMYFVKTNHNDCLCERHRIKIPILGWTKIKEKGYIPMTMSNYSIKSGTISYDCGKYFISAVACVPDKEIINNHCEGVGVDLGVLEFAVISNGRIYPNINKTPKMIKLKKLLEREQKSLSRKYEYFKKGGSTQKRNIQKQKLKIHKLKHKIYNIRNDYINKVIAEIIDSNPLYVTIEDLNVKGMIKNKCLSKAVSSQGLYAFRTKIKKKCHENNIELRIADRWYPSSKICHNCGQINNNLKLDDRVFKCSCGFSINRDLNASLNLRDTNKYTIA